MWRYHFGFIPECQTDDQLLLIQIALQHSLVFSKAVRQRMTFALVQAKTSVSVKCLLHEINRVQIAGFSFFLRQNFQLLLKRQNVVTGTLDNQLLAVEDQDRWRRIDRMSACEPSGPIRIDFTEPD